jgi:hypothetical protein
MPRPEDLASAAMAGIGSAATQQLKPRTDAFPPCGNTVHKVEDRQGRKTKK